MSYPSMILMPTAKPAMANRTQYFQPLRCPTSPNAMKHIPIPITCAATPQHAVEKKCELKVVASAPRMQASGESFHCRKQNQAQIPRTNRAVGQKILE